MRDPSSKKWNTVKDPDVAVSCEGYAQARNLQRLACRPAPMNTQYNDTQIWWCVIVVVCALGGTPNARTQKQRRQLVLIKGILGLSYKLASLHLDKEWQPDVVVPECNQV